MAEAVSAYGLVADTISVVAITRRKGSGIFSVLGGKLNLTLELSQLYTVRRLQWEDQWAGLIRRTHPVQI